MNDVRDLRVHHDVCVLRCTQASDTVHVNVDADHVYYEVNMSESVLGTSCLQVCVSAVTSVLLATVYI